MVFHIPLIYRSDLAQAVLCENFELVLRVIHKTILLPHNHSLLDWGLALYPSIVKVVREGHSEEGVQRMRMILAYRALVSVLLPTTEDTSVTDALCTILPSFLTHAMDRQIQSILSPLLVQLVEKSPNVLEKWIRPHLALVLNELPNAHLNHHFSLLVELSRVQGEKVTSMLNEEMMKVVNEVVGDGDEDVLDCMIFRPMIEMLSTAIHMFPYATIIIIIIIINTTTTIIIIDRRKKLLIFSTLRECINQQLNNQHQHRPRKVIRLVVNKMFETVPSPSHCILFFSLQLIHIDFALFQTVASFFLSSPTFLSLLISEVTELTVTISDNRRPLLLSTLLHCYKDHSNHVDHEHHHHHQQQQQPSSHEVLSSLEHHIIESTILTEDIPSVCRILDQCEQAGYHGLLTKAVMMYRELESSWWLEVLSIERVRESEVMKNGLREIIQKIVYVFICINHYYHH